MKQYMTKNLGLKLLSLLIAFALWIFVGLQNPELSMNYRDISLRYSADGSAVNAAGLSVINNKTTRVEVVARGKRSLLTSFSAAEIRAWVDISGITEPGTYTLDVQVTMPVSDLLIERITPSKVNLRLDKVVTKEVPVVLYLSNELDSEQYAVERQLVYPGKITISGPESDVENIAEARVNVTVGDTGIDGAEYDYILVNENGEAADSTYITSETARVKVTVPVSAKKEVPLRVDFVNNTTGWNESEISYTITPETITVSGDRTILDALESIDLGSIDLSELEGSTVRTFAIEMPEGVKNLSDNRTATVSVALSQMTQRVFTVSRFTVENLPADTEALVTTRSLDVRVRGREADLDRLTADQLVGVVDLQGKQIAYGEYELPVTIDLPDLVASVSGDYTVNVSIVRKQEGNR